MLDARSARSETAKDHQDRAEIGTVGKIKTPRAQRCAAGADSVGRALQGRKVKLTWNKVKNAEGYEVYGAVCSGDMKLQKVVKGKKLTLSKVSRKKLDKNKD